MYNVCIYVLFMFAYVCTYILLLNFLLIAHYLNATARNTLSPVDLDRLVNASRLLTVDVGAELYRQAEGMAYDPH